MKVGRAVVCALSLGSRLVSSKSELEMALEYSEYLAESDDEDGRALQALWKSLAEARARRASQDLFGSSGDGSTAASPLRQQ